MADQAQDGTESMPTGPRTLTVTRAQETYASWYIDILIYTVVLNLFVEYSEAVWIDSFTLSIFTAILLKLMLVAVGSFEHHIHDYFAGKEGRGWHIVGYVIVFAILVVSKFLILEVVDIVFGDQVSLGHFVEVMALIVTMIAARALAEGIYVWLGDGVGVSRTQSDHASNHS